MKEHFPFILLAEKRNHGVAENFAPVRISFIFSKFIWRINRATEFVCLSKAAGLDHDNDRF